MDPNQPNNDNMVQFANMTMVILYSLGACVGICGCCIYGYYKSRESKDNVATPVVYVSDTSFSKHTAKPLNAAESQV
jgi:hypothetical protein